MGDQKNTIIHHVTELLSSLHGHAPHESSVLTYVDQLVKTINPRLSSQVKLSKTKEVLIEGNPHAEAFISKYAELKVRNIRELDPFVYFLGKIRRDPELFQLLNRDVSKTTGVYGGTADTENTITEELHKHVQSGYGPTGDDTISNRHAQPSRLLPQWSYERPSLSSDFLPVSTLTAKVPSVLPLETLPLNAQEKLIVQNILCCLQANDGLYVKALSLDHKYSKRQFEIDGKMHPSLIDTVNKILPLCSNYSLISRFVEEKECYEYGRVNQALTEAIDRLLRDYWLLLCQLEDQFSANQLGMSRLLFLLKETSFLFAQLENLATNINMGGCTGGSVLSILNEGLRSSTALSQIHDCLLFLMRTACRPFFQILSKWIYRGIIDDRYGEFFIVKNVSPQQEEAILRTKTKASQQTQQNLIKNDYLESARYWEESYAIVNRQLPDFLESHAQKILKTGKYLNVVQQCDSSFKFSEPEEIVFSENERQFLDQIDRAHSFASKYLLDLILKQRDLKGILKSVKRYFLLDQGDFIIHFMDSADSELRKPNSMVNAGRLESLLELALSQSSANADPYKENLRVVSTNCDLITQVLNILNLESAWQQPVKIQDLNPSGLEAFSLDYQLEWPISLVINGPAMESYQMLFRLLFYCRHVERHLSTIWAMQKTARRTNTAAALWFNTAFILGQRMLVFIQHLQYYITFEVIEPTWLQFYQSLDKANNVEMVLEAHSHCLETCLDDCLLTCHDLLALVGKLNMVCINFANYCNKISLLSCGDEFTLSRSASVSSSRSRPLLHHPSLTNLADSSRGSVLSTGSERRRDGAGVQRHDSISSDAGGSSLFRGSLNSVSSSVDVRNKVTAYDLNSVGSLEEFSKAIDFADSTFNGLIVELLIKIRGPNANKRSKLQCLNTRLDFNCFYAQYSLNTASGNASDFGAIRDLRQSVSLCSLSTIDSGGQLSSGRPPLSGQRASSRGRANETGTPFLPLPRMSKPGSSRPPQVLDRRNSQRRTEGRRSRQTSPPIDT